MRDGSGNSPVVVVVGASSGIGRATARACARRGWAVVLAARAEESLAESERECGAGPTLAVPTDVTDADSVEGLFAAAVGRFGRVDAVVHTVGVVAYGRFDQVPAAVFDRVVETTLIGAATVARAALRLFAGQGGGRLVVVGSLLGKIVTPYMSSYVTAKWGLHGLVRVLQVEARQTPGVEVSLVSPGGVDTPAYLQAANYLGRVGRPPPPVDPPEKVARAVLKALDRPRREISVGLANPVIVLGFRIMPAVFDTLVLPLMRVGGLSRERVDPHEGNVFAPRPAGDARTGRWGRHWLRPVAGVAAGAGAGAVAALAGLKLRRTGG